MKTGKKVILGTIVTAGVFGIGYGLYRLLKAPPGPQEPLLEVTLTWDSDPTFEVGSEHTLHLHFRNLTGWEWSWYYNFKIGTVTMDHLTITLGPHVKRTRDLGPWIYSVPGIFPCWIEYHPVPFDPWDGFERIDFEDIVVE